jgi:chemotaxis protein MotA
VSIASILGVLLGYGMIVLAILGSTDDVRMFLHIPSILIVFGGTVAAAFMSYQSRDVQIAFRAIGWMVKKPKSPREGMQTEIGRLIRWGYLVAAKGLPALEQQVRSLRISEPLLHYCVQLVTSHYQPQDLRNMLETAFDQAYERQTQPVQVLRTMAAAAPAFGMIGTLVGMVIMLQSVGGDMSGLGQGLAIALLTTLYGVLLARLVFLPAAVKLEQMEELTRFRNQLMLEGLVMLAEKRSPRYMQDRLNSYLETDRHFEIDAQLRAQAMKQTTEPTKG